MAELAARLQAALAAEDDNCIVLYQMFDSNFFLARTEEGGMVPVCRRANGEYHVDGELVFAPKELQYSVFCDAKPLLEAAASRRKIIITSIPRYLLRGCCSDPEHVGNIKEPDYKSNLESAVTESRKLIKDFCFRQGIRNVRVVGPWPTLRAEGDSIWADTIHLTSQGYRLVADMALSAAADLKEKPEAAFVRGHKGSRDSDFPTGSGSKERRSWTSAGSSSSRQHQGGSWY